jgi:hypothetical protein
MEPIYSAARRLWRVRFCALMALVMGLAGLWGSWEAVRAYGLHPTEGGVLAPLPTRLALGGFLAVIGIGAPLGMWVFGRCYVVSAGLDERRGTLSITLAGLVATGRLEVKAEDVEGSTYERGETYAGGLAVAAPYERIRIRGRRLPLILDAQGEYLRPAFVNRYLLAKKQVRAGMG